MQHILNGNYLCIAYDGMKPQAHSLLRPGVMAVFQRLIERCNRNQWGNQFGNPFGDKCIIFKHLCDNIFGDGEIQGSERLCLWV